MASGLFSRINRNIRVRANLTPEQKQAMYDRNHKNRAKKLKKHPELALKAKEASKKYAEEIRAINKEKGLCMICGADRTDLRYVTCSMCRLKSREGAKRRREMKMENENESENKIQM
jgi:hypothetical protein